MIVFLLPGNTFTRRFVESWTALLREFSARMIPCGVRFGGGSDIYQVRNTILDGKERVGDWSEKKPLAPAEYEQLLWIDSDTVFSVQDVVTILDDPGDIVSGCVMMNPTMGNWGWYRHDEDTGKPCTSYLKVADIAEWRKKAGEGGLVEIDFAGAAFLKVRHGVYERMGYPWYRYTVGEFDGIPFSTSEDVGWCYRAKQAGFKIMGDTRVCLGHEKVRVLEWPKS